MKSLEPKYTLRKQEKREQYKKFNGQLPLNQYRQGDVFIDGQEMLEKKHLSKVLSAKKEKLVLAYGEATGHHHRFEVGSDVELLEDLETKEKYIHVGKEPAFLYHEEHAPIELPADFFGKVVIQREYSPEEIRRVMD